jgi:prepilin-type N-terminal cleavage/methylation domain-containing protein
MIATKKAVRGFTLIEILVVIGIIAILAAVVLIAINPARQFAQANDSQRSSNVTAILNAIGQYMADNKGVLPADVDSGFDGITEELCEDLVPTYLPALPTDPLSDFDGAAVEEADCDDLDDGVGPEDSGYEVEQDADGRITVRGQAEIDQDGDGDVDANDRIEVTR